MTAYDRVTDALRTSGRKVAEARPGQASAQCPAHEDQAPSLSLTKIEGQVLVHCHAGCHTEDVTTALNLTMRDLYDEPTGEKYRYTDPFGTVLRTVSRTPDKKFVQSGQTKGPSTLYRLPRVIQAAANDQVIYIVEGEKDVHALEAVGAVATTAPMGSSNWNKVDASPLHGAKVVVVVDKDEAGQKWAAQVHDSLDGKVQSLAFKQAAVGKDAADHIAAGRTLDQLDDLELDQRLVPSVITLSNVTPERVSWLWDGRLPAGKLVVIDGDPSTGKSTLTLDLAAHVSTGKPWPDGATCRVGDVLLLSAEDGLADTIAPRLVAAGANARHVHALTEVPMRNDDGEVRMVPPSLPRDIPTIKAIIARHKIKLVVVDVLMAYLNSGVDSHRDQDVRGVLHQLSAMAEASGCTIVLIRHLNKAGGSNALYRGGGSIGIVGAARAAFLVARDPEDEGRRIFAVTKSNLAVEPPALAYRLVDDPRVGCARVEWEAGTVDYTAASLLRLPDSDEDRTESGEAADWLVDLLETNGGSMSRKDITKAARVEGYSEKVLKTARTKAGVAAERVGFPSTTVWSISTVRPTEPQSGPLNTVGPTGTDRAPLDDEAPDDDRLPAPEPVPLFADEDVMRHGSTVCRACGNDLHVEHGMLARCRDKHTVKRSA